MKFYIINTETNKLYKENEKILEFTNFNKALFKLISLKNSNQSSEKLLIKQVSENETKYFNDNKEEIKYEIPNNEKDIIKINVDVKDNEINQEWEKIKNNSSTKIPFFTDENFTIKNIKKDEILINIIYIHNILYNLKKGKQLLNKKIFNNSKNNLIFFGEKLIESINQIDISSDKINLNYDNIKYY